MARSPKHAAATQSSTAGAGAAQDQVQVQTRTGAGAGAGAGGAKDAAGVGAGPGPAHAQPEAGPSRPSPPPSASATQRSSTRASTRRSSLATSLHTPGPADPPTPGPSALPSPGAMSHSQTPSATTAGAGASNPFVTPAAASGSGIRHPPKPIVEPKVHGLRHPQGDREKVPAPFPTAYGGKDKCALHDDDEKDEVFVAICSALAEMSNKALAPDEIANICFDNGWLRQPTAAVAPANMISSAIRSHQKRCDCANPSRPHLVAKYQLSGSAHETCLAPALHPNAFDHVRPKGTVWYLSTVGKTKWRNPFDGIEIPKAPPKKPSAPKKKVDKAAAADKAKKDGKKGATKDSSLPPKPRILLKVGTLKSKAEDGEMSDVGSSTGSRSRSWSITSGTPVPIASSSTSASASVPPSRSKPTRHPQSDTDTDSDTSDSDADMPDVTEIPRRPTIKHSRSSRKSAPHPLDLSNPPHSATSFLFDNPLFGSSCSRALPSAFGELFHPYAPTSPMMPTLSSQTQAQLHSSPFPSHSLDNTFWAARSHTDRMDFESSSSSSDDEMVEQDFGANSGILIRGIDGDESPELATPAEPVETSVKEATDALRSLYAIPVPDEQVQQEADFGDHRLDNRPPASASDSSSMAESSSTLTLTAQAVTQGLMRGHEGHVALAPIPLNSSPIGSPALRSQPLPLPVDISPVQHMSRLRDSFDPQAMDMDVDMAPDETQWLDEAGELPVKAEDTLSDIDIGSNLGDLASPEHDRRRDTAEWAREAAASFRIKDEPVEDFPSPLTTTTESDNHSPPAFNGSRASSASAETRTPSSRTSELPPFDMDEAADVVDLICGPESMPIEEIDGWLLPGMNKEKTPKRRGRPPGKARQATPVHAHTLPKAKCSIWGNIGVGTPFTTPFKKSAAANVSKPVPPSLSRSRSKRASLRASRKDDSTVSDVDEAIGTADLERVCAEADEREEQRRLLCRQKAEQQEALREALRQSMRDATDLSPSTELSTPAAWPDFGPAPWGSGSTESLNVVTPSAVSPMILHSVSTLSLRDVGVDPKALLSPLGGTGTPSVARAGDALAGVAADDPMGLTDGMGMLDDVMSQAEVEAVIQTVSPSPGVPEASPNAPSAHTSTATSSTLAPAPVRPTAPTTASSPLSSASPSPVPSANAPAAASATKVEAADKEKSATPSSTSTSASKTDAKPAVAAAAPAGKQYARILKPLCPGVVASVVDNIPVYSHTPDGGRTQVLRRLDTDFVNGSTLLSALGVPGPKQADFFARHTRWAQYRHPVPSICGKTHHAYHTGVAGIWVTLVEARAVAKQFKLDESKPLASLLKEDLFLIFAAMANLSSEHHAALSFGLPFTAEGPNFYSEPPAVRGKPIAPAATGQAAQNTAFAQSAVNSKSTPNLSALSTTAPSGPAPLGQLKTPVKALTKAQLVRSAPPTPPDGCPQPKRRRATIVGAKPELQPAPSASSTGAATSPALAPKAPVPIAPSTSAVGSPTSGSHGPSSIGVGRKPVPVGKQTAAQRRATRASISGMGVDKPRVGAPLAPALSASATAGAGFNKGAAAPMGAAQGTRAKGGPVVPGVGVGVAAK